MVAAWNKTGLRSRPSYVRSLGRTLPLRAATVGRISIVVDTNPAHPPHICSVWSYCGAQN
eukprot:COSAG02_NODE_65176_length_258_cov_1.308176_1_plen_59_part_10